MILYPKIDTLFVRDDKTHKLVEPLVLRRPIMEHISHWICTEKIDGTNIRIECDTTGNVSESGRTNNAQLPADLVRWCYEKFTPEKMAELKTEPVTLTIFGEGYGAGIQKGGNYREDKSVILFDACVTVNDRNHWLSDNTVTDFASRLGVDRVPRLKAMRLDEIVSNVRLGFHSLIPGSNCLAEGIVARTIEPLYDRRGDRLILKLKTKDFS